MPAPRPSDTTITWATDANFAAGSDPWSGQPTKAAPSSGTKASGFVPGTGALAQIVNYVLNVLAGWAAWLADHSGSDDEWSYPTAKTIKRSTPIAMFAPTVAATDWTINPGAAEVDAMVDRARGHIPLFVRVGETLTGAVVHVAPQSNRTGANRMTFRIYEVVENFGVASPSSANDQTITSPDAGSSDRWDAGGTGPQDATLTLATPIVVTEGHSYFLWIESGNDSGTAGKHDRVYAARALITKPGPR